MKLEDKNHHVDSDYEKMAKIELKILALPLFAITLLMAVNGYGTIVGGKTPIQDVKTNKGIQALGVYAVNERNKGLTNGGEVLVFCEVVEAEQQVVSGIQYFLKIEATENEQMKMFDSVVLVKPWSKSEEKELISFSASAQQPGVVAKPPPTR